MKKKKKYKIFYINSKFSPGIQVLVKSARLDYSKLRVYLEF
jgi:hypothetical protein